MSRKETMIKKLGGEENYRAYMRSIASVAGKKRVLKGWAKRNADIAAGLPVSPRKSKKTVAIS